MTNIKKARLGIFIVGLLVIILWGALKESRLERQLRQTTDLMAALEKEVVAAYKIVSEAKEHADYWRMEAEKALREADAYRREVQTLEKERNKLKEQIATMAPDDVVITLRTELQCNDIVRKVETVEFSLACAKEGLFRIMQGNNFKLSYEASVKENTALRQSINSYKKAAEETDIQVKYLHKIIDTKNLELSVANDTIKSLLKDASKSKKRNVWKTAGIGIVGFALGALISK